MVWPSRAEHQALQSGRVAIADEWAEQHEAANEVRLLGCGERAGTGAHRVADDDRRGVQLLDQSEHVAGGLDVAVGAECRVAVAVAAKVGATTR